MTPTADDARALVRRAERALEPDDFFELVDELLAPAMRVLGYNPLVPVVNDNPDSRSATASTETSGSSAESALPFLVYDYGFEAGSAAVRRAVDRDDPDSADELWLHHEPATGILDLSSWETIAEGRVGWDVVADRGPCSAAEVRRRLRELGRAVRTFPGDIPTTG